MRGHDLINLWKKTKPIILEGATSQEDVAIVESYIMQFHELDKNSYSFRYPINKDLEQILDNQRRINLPSLRQRIDEPSCFFNGLDVMLSNIRDYRQSMEEYLP